MVNLFLTASVADRQGALGTGSMEDQHGASSWFVGKDQLPSLWDFGGREYREEKTARYVIGEEREIFEGPIGW